MAQSNLKKGGSVSKIHKIFVGGYWRETATPVKVTSPFDGSAVGVTYLAGQPEIEDAVASAVSAFEVLKRMASHERAALIGRVIEGLGARADELARIISLESGKPIRDARAEVKRAVGTFQIALEEAKRPEGSVVPVDIAPGSEGRLAIVRRFPVGPVLAICPFNFPLNLVVHKVAPAMACGNPVIVKPAPKTPITALILAEIIEKAGCVKGAFSVMPCSNEDAERLVLDDRIKKLSFTGSAAVGWWLKSKAGTKRVTLELGGNAGVIVHSDADLESASARCATGAFLYAGQVCISVQRVYVQNGVFERFKELFLGHCSGLKLGDPLDEATDIGPMVDEGACVRSEEWVKEAVSGGAKLLLGGRRTGRFFEPTVLTGTLPSMKVCSEEVFAPIVSIEPYEAFEDAVDMVNGSLYGLQAGVFTKDISRIMRAYERLEVGGVIANDIPTYRTDNMPYGGVKMSGFGREGVRYAIEEMTEPRLLVIKA